MMCRTASGITNGWVNSAHLRILLSWIHEPFTWEWQQMLPHEFAQLSQVGTKEMRLLIGMSTLIGN